MRLWVGLGLAMSLAVPLVAQERGSWRPASKTAQSITGDVTFNGERMTINFFSLTVAEIRPLKTDEVLAAFDGADVTAGAGHLFRLSIPGDKRFLHKNTLCGSDETQWMATFVAGKELKIAFFSNAIPPVFTIEALGKSENLCGVYTYARY
ncbi:hypothetical protein HDF16_001933 [Granulicella aggregans]|uniref:Uncharacterized protein n=1 Tax=Granulicella aggregans TaxID=474949 RepID=A0A7W7ZCD4_9BACT|nr:hypothetical protein [Granulicella aggregans]MBB5057248.1 hypothetical protein [Granulicella aggregans]